MPGLSIKDRFATELIENYGIPTECTSELGTQVVNEIKTYYAISIEMTPMPIQYRLVYKWFQGKPYENIAIFDSKFEKERLGKKEKEEIDTMVTILQNNGYTEGNGYVIVNTDDISVALGKELWLDFKVIKVICRTTLNARCRVIYKLYAYFDSLTAAIGTEMLAVKGPNTSVLATTQAPATPTRATSAPVNQPPGKKRKVGADVALESKIAE